MFVNDLSGHYGGNWQYPGTWIGQHQTPYFYGWGTVPQNFYGVGNQTLPQNYQGFGNTMIPQNYQGLGNTMMPQQFQGIGNHTMPYFHNLGTTQNHSWLNGQTWPQNVMSNPFNTGMNSGLGYNYNCNYNTTPFTNTYLGQGYTPFHGQINNPFTGCR
jgi:hypothetical protein